LNNKKKLIFIKFLFDKFKKVIDSGILGDVIRAYYKGNYAEKKEAVWVLGNGLTTGTQSQIKHFISIDSLKVLCDFLINVHDDEMLNVILDSILIILQYDEANQGRKFIKNHHCTETIEELKNHKSSIINDKSNRVIEMLENDQLNDDLDVLIDANNIFDSEYNNGEIENTENEDEDDKDVVLFRESLNNNNED
jgi:hypothetical protein